MILNQEQILEILLSGLLFGVILLAIEFLKRNDRIHLEASRKAVHISAGIVLASFPLYMERAQVVITNFAFFFSVVLLVGVLHIFTSVHAVKRWTIGEFLYPIGTGLTALIFTDLRIYVFAVYMLAIGDGLAGLLGRSYGGKGYKIWGGSKSLFGNIVFFTVSIILTSVFWYYTQNSLSIIAVGMILLSSALLTLVEATFAGGFDNLAVPLASGWVAYLILVF